MLLVFYFTFMLIIFLFLIIHLIPIINMHIKKNREKKSPFECGFDPFSKSRTSFSIHFFSISLMFLIFDIEITLILPSPILFNKINFFSWLVLSCSMMFILLLSTAIEWKEGSLNWNYG